ncbi:LarC family nickel insertion protein [uncultured Methylobacterium sp.]|uniref:LarC family nickel insertion protein n=1 Tax=uncultured Methylobacterium sp. TaxID=157278 RepID=UPI00258B1328|nr:LarC family nickel insertion protein [uncultured Methylobacterium sp.]
MQIHLDAVGGVAGDMVAAALLDAFPEHEVGVRESVARASRGRTACTLLAHGDGVLQGRRFAVAGPEGEAPDRPADDHGHHHHDHHHHGDHTAHHHHDHDRHHHHGGGHAHRHWSAIRRDLEASGLAPAVLAHTLAIFGHLAEAEARVHGIPVADVAFHEVGAWDSIADIVAAAHLIDAIGATRWSVSALPLGSGRVMTQHGPLPVPAPATALLLEGFLTLDDGVPGERVTPTGAAILRHLCGEQPKKSGPRRLLRSGLGFGTKVLPGLSNVLRVLAFEEQGETGSPGHRELGIIEFEVDDQSAEDLAMGLDRLRAHDKIFDVVQMPVFGKKGRMMTHVRALARADAIEEAIEACFRETTTIGLRHHTVSGAALTRRLDTVEVAGRTVRVKSVARPGGRTAKAESDDALATEGHAARQALRREAERLALSLPEDER